MPGNISYGDLEGNERKGFKAAVDKALQEQYGQGLEADTPEPTQLIPSGIRPIPAEEQIKKYLKDITPKDPPTKFRFESCMAGFAFGTVGLAICVVVLTLLFGGWL